MTTTPAEAPKPKVEEPTEDETEAIKAGTKKESKTGLSPTGEALSAKYDAEFVKGALETKNEGDQAREQEAVDKAERARKKLEKKEREDREKAEAERTQTERLDRARDNYLKHRAELQKAESVKGWWTGQRKDVPQIQTELARVKEAYERARAEYVGESVEKMMAEEGKLKEAQVTIFSPEKSEGKIAQWYRKMGETSVLGTKDYKGPFKRTVKFLTNNRTLLNAALIGAAVVSGPGGWIAGGALISRRLMSGLGAGFGSSELVKNARRSNLQKEIPIYSSLEQFDDRLEAIRARAGLDGTLDKLKDNKVYQEALAQRNAKLKENFETLPPAEKLRYINEFFGQQEAKLDEKITNEKKWNRRAFYTGIAAGVFVGSGTMMQMLKGEFSLKDSINGIKGWFSQGPMPDVARPDLSSMQPRGPDAPWVPEAGGIGVVAGDGLPAEGAAETAAASSAAETAGTVLHAGKRGIEGAMLDHLKTEKGANMLKWLQAQEYNKGITNNGALVDRFVRHYAEEKGFNVDLVGGKDLSKIFEAGIDVNDATGEPTIGGEKFMPAVAETATSDTPAPEATPEPAPAPTGETFLNPDQLKAQFDYNAFPDSSKGMSFNPDTLADNSDVSTEVAAAPETGGKVAELTALDEGRFEAALSQDKASNALQLMLNKDYPRFLQNLDLKGPDLDKIRNLKYTEFLQKFADSESFRDKYGKLAAMLKTEVKPQLQSVNIRWLLIAIVRNKQEQGLV